MSSSHEPHAAASYYSASTSLPLPPLAKRRFDWSDLFFYDGNEERERGAKNFKYGRGEIAKQILPGQEDTLFDNYIDEFTCDIEGCHQVFNSLSTFDEHYLIYHTYRCEICGLRLPNNRLLEMHIAERHDELFRVMAKTKRMFACLVEGCPQKSNTRTGRQQHLVVKHSYPPNYTYDRLIRREVKKRERKEKPKKLKMNDEEMVDDHAPPITSASTITTPSFINSTSSSTHLTFASSPSSSSTAFPASSSATSSSSSIAITAASSSSRPVASTRSTLLSFVPRSLRQTMKPPSFPTNAPAFTEMRDTPPQRIVAKPAIPTKSNDPVARLLDDDQMTDEHEDKENHQHQEHDDSASSTFHDSSMTDLDAQMQSLSRLHVDGDAAHQRTLPKKLTFGSMNRRHA